MNQGGEYGFLFGQEDLRARSLMPRLTEREYFPSNHVYAAGDILREYAGLPVAVPLPWVVQTVVSYRIIRGGLPDDPANRQFVQKTLRSKTPTCLIFDTAWEEGLLKAGVPAVHPIGTTFLYARELYRRAGFDTPVERRGTIALPDKSDEGKVVDFDREAYAAKLAALPAEYQPVYVSIHWRDFDRGCHEPYLRAGLKMVCSGHPYEPLFYQRLYDICRRFKYSCSNEISTSFALSVISGCHFFYLDGGPVSIVWTRKPAYHGPEPLLPYSGRPACVQASPFPPEENGRARQRECAALVTGERHFRQPEFFRELWEPARDALSALLDTGPFIMGDRSHTEQFARWLPEGFDADGWAGSDCALEIPARDGFSGVEIELEFPFFKQQGGKPALEMRHDGSTTPVSNSVIETPCQRVFVPTRDDGARRRVRFHGPPAITLPGEERARSFLLRGIQWRRETIV